MFPAIVCVLKLPITILLHSKKVYAMFKCINEKYDPSGTEPYASVQKFLDMCKMCYNKEPVLHDRTGRGDYFDENGDKVLLRCTKDCLAIYDLDPQTEELLAVAGPSGWKISEIDCDDLPKGFRFITNEEWEELQK
jgi:hypothetical protein